MPAWRHKKPKYQSVSKEQLRDLQLQYFHLNEKDYLYCPKHKAVFVKGHECPECSKPVRSIYDDWQTSMDEQPPEPQTAQDVGMSVIAAMAGQEPPKPGIYKIGRCTKHDMPYIIGISECPECKVDSLEWIRKTP